MVATAVFPDIKLNLPVEFDDGFGIAKLKLSTKDTSDIVKLLNDGLLLSTLNVVFCVPVW